MNATFMQWGAILAPPGHTDPSIHAAGGNPYRTNTTSVQDGRLSDEIRAAVEHQARRLVDFAQRVAA